MLLLLAVATAALSLVWVYVVNLPMAFLDDEYPRWAAKRALLGSCDTGDVLILGDSRAAVAIAPRQIATRVTNLALAGSSSIEAYTVAERALRCPRLPRRVILSLSPIQLTGAGTLWDKSVRYRLLGWPELKTLLDVSHQAGDYSAFSFEDRDGLPPFLKALVHGIRFPSLYFNSLVQNGVILRLKSNEAILRDVTAARGQYFFLPQPFDPSRAFTPEVAMSRIAPPPVLDAYMGRLLDLLEHKGIQVDFVAMPINASSGGRIGSTVRGDLDRYLRALEQRYPNFHVLGDTLPSWPDPYFNDTLAHFNTHGTEVFSNRLAACLDAAGSSAVGLAAIATCRALLNQP